MIVQGKPKLKTIEEKEYRTRRTEKQNYIVNKIIEKFQKLIPVINEPQILENYNKLLNQLTTFDEGLEKQVLDHILETLKKSKLDELQLGIDSFLRIFEDILQSFTIRLNSSDVKILEAIYLQPLISLEGICSTTNLSWGTVQKRYNQLTCGNVYKVVAVPNYEKLGLVPIIVITLGGEREIYSQYLTSFHKNNGWYNTTRLWEILLPESNAKESERIILRHMHNPQIFEKTFVTSSINFYYYDRNSKKWNINWFHWELQLEKQEKTSLTINLNRHANKKRKIKKIDLKILSHLTENLRKEQRAIAQTLNTSESKVSLCKKVLNYEKYFTPITQLTERAGLTENLLIISKENFQEIPAAFLKLPQITVHKLTDHNKKTKQTIIQTKLPPGSKTRIKEILERIYPDIQFSNYTIQTESFPKGIAEMFDEKNQKWIWNPLTLKIYEKSIQNPEYRNYVDQTQKIEA
ncbi:MAG: hypothetical protein ACUVXA_11605 [Candidatus Jordarchaeum sp.]|uniref:hypothetical protein n=1 Tax=Candidatus Jordarchaeum sp. TaxID=2823881 RepID=UPI00404ADF30